MAETTIVYSVDRKSVHKPESENDNGECQRKRGLAMKSMISAQNRHFVERHWYWHWYTDLFGKLTTINEQSMVLVKTQLRLGLFSRQ